MNIQDAYTNWSASYDSDRNLTRDLDQTVTRDSLGNLRCQSILELGCGTGKNTAFLARIGAQVHALDFSPGMLAQARAKRPAAHVKFEQADITQAWPCARQSVDLIVCNLVLEHIQDLSFIFSEAARVLVPGGRIFICELHPSRQYQGRQANFQHGPDTVAIPAFTHHISEFIDTAARHGLKLQTLREWWHQADQNKAPRLVSFLFEK